MADEDLRAGLQTTIDHNPLQCLYGSFTLGLTDGDSTIFTIPDNCQVIDGYFDITTGATATAQSIQLVLSDPADEELIPATDAKVAALTRMITGDFQKSDAAGTIQLVRSASDTVTVGCTVSVMLLVFRANQ